MTPNYGNGMPAKLALTATVALLALTGSAVAAEPYPDRPITVIVPYAAGGSSDVLARFIAEPLFCSNSLGRP
jgi:tripartite-type tricarboxylate transporter receptor subunit TctC